MRDNDIRKSLRERLKGQHEDDPLTLVVEELGVCEGSSRVDMAVINGSMHGYEIKSERDRLKRLPRQSDTYGRCFDEMTLVVGQKHLDAAIASIPVWWGVLQAIAEGDMVRLHVMREAQPNPGVSPRDVVQLLWHGEALEVLEEIGKGRRMRSRPRRELWNALVEALEEAELRRFVREKIKARGDWRVERRRVRGNDSSPTSATAPGSPAENLKWLLSHESHNPPD